MYSDGAWQRPVPRGPELAAAVEDRSVAAAFLHTGTVAMFEHHGFERTRQIGKNRWVVTKVVPGRLARPA